jgi:uncharacterized protein (DUF58 family)
MVPAWGWPFLGVALIFLVTGWWLGWPELAVPGAVVMAVFVAGSVSTLSNPRLDVALEAAHRRVTVGGDPGVRLRITNRDSRKVPGGSLMLPVGERMVPVRVASLAPGASLVAEVAIPTNRRALLHIGPAKAVRGDPFGMVARTWSWGSPLELTVCPITVAVPVGWPGLAKDVEGKLTGQPSEADFSFHGLRQYFHGDDMRAIHWRSSARLGQIMVRQSEDIRRARMALIVSTSAREYACQGDFELAVSVYASIGLAQLNESGDLAVVAAGATLPVVRASRAALFDQSAAVAMTQPGDGQSGEAGHDLAAAAARARSEIPGATLAILITGDRLTARDLRRITLFLPGQIPALALCCRTGAEISVSRLGRLSWASLGRLQDLPRVMRKLGLS